MNRDPSHPEGELTVQLHGAMDAEWSVVSARYYRALPRAG